MSDYYDFEVVKDNQVVSAKRRIRLARVRAAWPIIAELAARHVKGSLIRVRNARGEIEILIGVAAARRTLASARSYAALAAVLAAGATIEPLFA